MTTYFYGRNSDLDSFDTELILELQDKSKFDIGHTRTPRAKGGEASIGNLDLQDISENRRQQDKH